MGGKISRIANASELREWVAACSGLPGWLVEDSYDHVGDLGETATLLLDDPPNRRAWSTGCAIGSKRSYCPCQAPSRRVGANWSHRPGRAFRKISAWSSTRSSPARFGLVCRIDWRKQALAESPDLDLALIAKRMFGSERLSAEALRAMLPSKP